MFLIPVASEVLGTVEALADIAVVLSIASTAVDIGLSVADIIKNPNNAALDIMNIVFDAGALASVSKVSKAANIRREMKDADITKLGTKVSDGLKTLEKIIGKCTACMFLTFGSFSHCMYTLLCCVLSSRETYIS